ncbi:nucleotidyltransferase domain-containing protein [Nocardioides sp.]|uniref:nucleotidyltransferase domain-containing protein n=1 Tax=Nocardioides sp. TaxID=35761 RepID=UPI0035B3FEDC
MTRPDAETAARSLIAERFPDAWQAWLSGSVVLGHATATSDLDITVVLDEAEVHRESLVHEGWPVELFVHTESSIRHFVAKDRARRRPTMARLVATGLPLVPGDAGEALRAECAAAVAAGPDPLSAEELTFQRYSLTDQLDDLVGGGSPGVVDAVAIDVWRGTAELLLASGGWWSGTGKWLVREVEAFDAARGTTYATHLHDGLHAALAGDPGALVELADEVLEQVGGRLWSGFRLAATIPD